MNEQMTGTMPGLAPPAAALGPIQEFWIADLPIPEIHTPDVHHESFRVAEVSQLLGISVDRIRHAVQAGELAAERIGHEIVRIRRADLLAWLDTQGPGV